MTKIERKLCKELERKQIDLFAKGHQGRKNSRRYVQLIDAQDALKRRGRSSRSATNKRRT